MRGLSPREKTKGYVSQGERHEGFVSQGEDKGVCLSG